jgi:hypothetical protein
MKSQDRGRWLAVSGSLLGVLLCCQAGCAAALPAAEAVWQGPTAASARAARTAAQASAAAATPTQLLSDEPALFFGPLGDDPLINRTMVPPRIFARLGPLSAPDSQALSNRVYDRAGGGPVNRLMPSPLDVAVLGNNQALQLLQPELLRYRYAPERAAMRVLLDGLGPAKGQCSLYGGWIDAVRALSADGSAARSTAAGVPEVATTEAWGHRILTTQLACWTERRHDTILYSRQSYSSGLASQFPNAYVEPNQQFFSAGARLGAQGAAAPAGQKGQVPPLDSGTRQLPPSKTSLRWRAFYGRSSRPALRAALHARPPGIHQRAGPHRCHRRVLLAARTGLEHQAVLVSASDPPAGIAWMPRLCRGELRHGDLSSGAVAAPSRPPRSKPSALRAGRGRHLQSRPRFAAGPAARTGSTIDRGRPWAGRCAQVASACSVPSLGSKPIAFRRCAHATSHLGACSPVACASGPGCRLIHHGRGGPAISLV